MNCGAVRLGILKSIGILLLILALIWKQGDFGILLIAVSKLGCFVRALMLFGGVFVVHYIFTLSTGMSEISTIN